MIIYSHNIQINVLNMKLYYHLSLSYYGYGYHYFIW